MIWRVIWKVIGWCTVIAIGAGVIGIGVALYAYLPRPLPESEVIGHWEAEPGKHGTADFYADGTFKMEGLSMDIIHGYDAFGLVYASGTWRTYKNSENLKLRFSAYEDRGPDFVESTRPIGFTHPTLGWGSHRQLYFSDLDENNKFRMNRVSDEPEGSPSEVTPGPGHEEGSRSQ